MLFGETPLDKAEGAILAHSVRLTNATFKKGRVLSAADIDALRADGIMVVIAARLEKTDVGEDEAAKRVANVLAGNNLRAGPAFTGRANLIAEKSGLVTFDRGSLERINLVHESLTVATLPEFELVEEGGLVATIKVIPFAAPVNAVEAIESIARSMCVTPFIPTAAGLIQSRLPQTKESVLDKTVDVTRERMERYGGSLDFEQRCRHDSADISDAIAQAIQQDVGIVLIAGASAITDRRDVIPTAIVQAGGQIEHFGMPVDPGNLLLLGRLANDTPVIGLPGCARSPKTNGFDWILERVLAGLKVSGDDIKRMGVGGLLKEIPSRPLPRDEAARDTDMSATAPRVPKIAALVMAAGQSRRMGAENKLLADVKGTPMVRRVLDQVVASDAGPIAVVLGHEPERVKECLSGSDITPDITFVENPDFEQGLSTSLIRGLEVLPDDIDGVVICLGDMPRVASDDINRLIAAFSPIEGRAICVPTHRGKRGNPVLWSHRFFDEMRHLHGDVGARHLIGEYADVVAEIEMEADGVLLDVDTPKKLSDIAALS
jgi:molybdenum cofactor cytidylyltransferase